MPGLLSTGWEPKRLEDIETEMKNSLWTNISPDLDLSSTSLLGQYVSIIASQIAQLWEASQDIYTGWDPDQAIDDALTSISKITGTSRLPAAPTEVSCLVDLSVGTYLAGSLIIYKTGDPEARFTNKNTYNQLVPGSVSIPFIATVDGPIIAPVNSLLNIATPVVGFNSILANSEGVTGRYTETNAELRLRREQGLARRGSGTVDAIRADLLAIPSVTQVSVLENDGDVVNGFGVPAHGVMALVVGGADQTIIDTLWASKSPDTATGGATSGIAVDGIGNSHTVRFQRPTDVPVYSTMTVTVLNGYQGDIVSKVKAAVKATLQGRVGWDVIYSKIGGAAVSLEGVVDVTLVMLAKVASPPGTSNVVIAYNEYATIQDSDITVTVVVVSDYP